MFDYKSDGTQGRRESPSEGRGGGGGGEGVLRLNFADNIFCFCR